MMFPPDLEISDCSTTFWGSPSVCILYVCVRVICVYIYINDGSVYMYIHIGREREREKKNGVDFLNMRSFIFKKTSPKWESCSASRQIIHILSSGICGSYMVDPQP